VQPYQPGGKEIEMDFVKVVDQADLPANKMIMVVVAGKEVLLANIDGTYHAIANKCTHAGGSLAKGILDGCIVTCPRHGAQFDVRNGKAVRDAKFAFIKMKAANEESYTVKVEGTSVMVGIP
jgi:3-phenylpropionate/trans-cinnamate dioxygenase ferredoxin component